MMDEMTDDILIDVEEPDMPVETIPLHRAIERYRLERAEVNALMKGKVVWYKDIALTLSGEKGDE